MVWPAGSVQAGDFRCRPRAMEAIFFSASVRRAMESAASQAVLLRLLEILGIFRDEQRLIGQKRIGDLVQRQIFLCSGNSGKLACRDTGRGWPFGGWFR